MIPFLIALQFLTRLPVRLPGMPEPTEVGRSLIWYPVVGLLVGALLMAGAVLLEGSPPLLAAALLLAAWVGALRWAAPRRPGRYGGRLGRWLRRF